MFTLIEGLAVGRYEEFILNDVPQNVRANEEHFYGRSDKIFRHIETHLHRHLQKVVTAVSQFAKSDEITGVLLGGHEEIFKKVKKHLPLNLSRKVKGTFITELKGSFNDVIRTANRIISDIEKGKIVFNAYY